MGRRCAFSARKRSEARRPAEREPSVKPERKESEVVRRRRRSKGMPRRGVVVGFEGEEEGGGVRDSRGDEERVVDGRAVITVGVSPWRAEGGWCVEGCG